MVAKIRNPKKMNGKKCGARKKVNQLMTKKIAANAAKIFKVNFMAIIFNLNYALTEYFQPQESTSVYKINI